MKSRTKKILAIVLAIATVCMMAPAAFAADNNVAKVDDTEYATVNEAIANANGKTVVLIENVAEDVVVPSGVTVTLDVNGKTLTNKSGNTITNKGTMTVQGSGTIDNVNHAKCALLNDVGGTATVKGSVKLTRSKEDGKSNTYYVIVNHGVEMTIQDNIEVTQNGNYSSMVENGWYNGNQNASKKNSKLTIAGGTFNGGLNTIKNDDYGELEIKAGTFINIVQSAVMNWNIATISGGEFTIKDGASGTVVLNGKFDDVMDKGILEITGGIFNGNGNSAIQSISNNYGNSSGDIEIKGGEFNGDIVLIGDKDGGKVTIDASKAKMGSGNKIVVKDMVKDDVVVNNGTSIEYFKKGADEKQMEVYFGDGIKEVAKKANAGDELYVRGDANLTIPTAGVIVNKSVDSKVIVNGDTVVEGYVTKAPTTPGDDEETPTVPDKTPVTDEPSKDPQTNSDDELVTFTCVAFALVIGAAVLVYSRKKRNN